jgi:RHS repeat-associated protein
VSKSPAPVPDAETLAPSPPLNRHLSSCLGQPPLRLNHARYDQLNRLTQKSYPDTSQVNYTSDDDSRLTQVTDPTGTYHFTFDNMGRLTGTSTQYAFLTSRTLTTSYGYDAASNRSSFTDPEGGNTSYAFDTLNRLQTLTPPAAISGGNLGFGYDVLSRRTSLTRPNGVNTSYGYDNLSHLLTVTHAKNGTTLDGATYTVDNAGNRLTRTPQPSGAASTYGYDNIYELQSVTQNGSTTESYTYDPVGNRLSNVSGSGWSYNTSNELNSRPSYSYTYDYNGNTQTMMNSSGTTTYAWDFENRLTNVTLPGSGGTVTFKYDPFGRRIYKSSSSGTSIYAYDGQYLTEEANASGGAVARYVQGLSIDEPLAELRSGITSYYEADGVASVTSLTTSSGASAQTYTYDSLGNVVVATGSVVNPFRYTGREFDAETGLYSYRARYFDSQAGRFISEDPIGLGGNSLNFYEYAYNSPANWIDPSGMQQLGIGIEPPAGRAVSNGVLDPSDDPGHTIVFLKDPSGQITNVLSFGPAKNINIWNKGTFEKGNLPATANWPIQGNLSVYLWPLPPQKYADCKKLLEEIKKQPGNFTPQRTCTSVSIKLAQDCGIKVPNGVSPIRIPGWRSGSYPNPFGLQQQLNSGGPSPIVMPASQFPH